MDTTIHNKKGFSEKDFGSMLDKYGYNLHTGDIVAGTVFNRESKGLLVDIGADIAGYLPEEEISLITHDESIEDRILPLINETREFFIVAYNKKSHQLLLSIKRLEYIRAWKRIKQIQTEDVIINAIVININKGGLLVRIEGLKSFIPNSHITTQEKKIIKIDQIIECKLLVADERKNQLICSNKCALLAKFTDRFKIGNIVNGEITEIKKYGLFITIHGIPALLHISEIGYKHIDNINTKFALGNKIQVKIIHIDTKQGRLSVSTRDI